MTEAEIIYTLLRAKPIEPSDSELVNKAHAKAVKKAEMLIKLCDDPYQMSILVDRYLKGMTFKELASERHIGVSTVHRLHGLAIERIRDAQDNKDTHKGRSGDR